MDLLQEIVIQIELHSVEGIIKCFEAGLDPNIQFKNEPLIYELTSEYTRSPRFKECVKVFVDHGLQFNDKALLAVLLDDSKSLELLTRELTEIINKKYSLRCAYTPMDEVTLLHICAEFNHLSCAEILIKYGAHINAKAGLDENGFGGQSAVFHTVNQNGNQSYDMLQFLLAQNADLAITVPGLVWGKGYEWETLMPAINPISYAMMGLLPQMHRGEITISKIVTLLLEHSYGIRYSSRNVPNRYLKN